METNSSNNNGEAGTPATAETGASASGNNAATNVMTTVSNDVVERLKSKVDETLKLIDDRADNLVNIYPKLASFFEAVKTSLRKTLETDLVNAKDNNLQKTTSLFALQSTFSIYYWITTFLAAYNNAFTLPGNPAAADQRIFTLQKEQFQDEFLAEFKAADNKGDLFIVLPKVLAKMNLIRATNQTRLLEGINKLNENIKNLSNNNSSSTVQSLEATLVSNYKVENKAKYSYSMEATAASTGSATNPQSTDIILGLLYAKIPMTDINNNLNTLTTTYPDLARYFNPLKIYLNKIYNDSRRTTGSEETKFEKLFSAQSTLAIQLYISQFLIAYNAAFNPPAELPEKDKEIYSLQKSQFQKELFSLVSNPKTSDLLSSLPVALVKMNIIGGTNQNRMLNLSSKLTAEYEELKKEAESKPSTGDDKEKQPEPTKPTTPETKETQSSTKWIITVAILSALAVSVALNITFIISLAVVASKLKRKDHHNKIKV
ncbi:hypothetical protein ACJA23_02745 [Mycoplasma corogypsi]|uniref:hypothetical protein n=1 Tax=Mycoplasma corogypsi TaxID=2106 RepID=UPI0038735BB3